MNPKTVAAAANVLQAHWSAEDAAVQLLADPGAFFLAVADKALRSAAVEDRKGRTIRAIMKDGSAITIMAYDKQDLIPGFDEQHRRYEAYTTYFRSDRFETYVQVDKFLAEKSGDVDAFRLMEDLSALAAHGVDIQTIAMDD